MRHDLISDVMFVLNDADRYGKKECVVKASKLVKNILILIQNKGFIGSFELEEDGKQGIFKIEMNGKINHSRAIKPRFSVKNDEIEKWEKRYLPSKDIGFILISTNEGILDHNTVKEKSFGGKLIGYVY